MQFTLPEQSDWCNNMPIRSYDYAPVLPVKVSRPYFLMSPQGAREKFGLGTRLTGLVLEHHAVPNQYVGIGNNIL